MKSGTKLSSAGGGRILGLGCAIGFSKTARPVDRTLDDFVKVQASKDARSRFDGYATTRLVIMTLVSECHGLLFIHIEQLLFLVHQILIFRLQGNQVSLSSKLILPHAYDPWRIISYPP